MSVHATPQVLEVGSSDIVSPRLRWARPHLFRKTGAWNLESGWTQLAKASSRAALDRADEGVRPPVDRDGRRKDFLGENSLFSVWGLSNTAPYSLIADG